MKQLLHAFFALAFFTNCIAQTTNEAPSCKENIAAMEAQSKAKFFEPIPTMALNNYDVVHYYCYWEIDPAVKKIKGAITTHFKPTTAGFNKLEFDLNKVLTVDSVIYHAAKVSFTQVTGDLLKITLPAVIEINTLDSVKVYYKGVPPSTGMGAFTQSTHNGTPVIWTLSEPYGARDWWPCKQNMLDKADSIDIEVRVPKVNRVGSNGRLVSETTVGSDKIFHWKSTYPIATYLIGIAVTNYAAYSDFVPMQNGTLEVLNYIYPEDLATIKPQTKDIVKIIQFFNSLTIEYPFKKEKYGHAQFGWSGGMEHQTMSFMVKFSLKLLAHECAHQWFGDYITAASWQEIWLNEGFATYFEGMSVERFTPQDWMKWKSDNLTKIISKPDGSVFCTDTTSVGRVFDGRLTYAKGAYLVHMLRWKLGDVAFFNGLKSYLTDPLLIGKFSTSSALKKHLETASGQDLTTFFKQWYFKEGYPTYQVKWWQKADFVSVTINQTQSHSSVSFFEMPVPVKFVGTSKDTTIVFDHTFSGQTFNTVINFPVKKVLFDPEKWLISGNNSIAVGIDDLPAKQLKINLYPIPSGNNLTIKDLPENTTITNLRIIDALGKTVYENKQVQACANNFTIDIQHLTKGVYLLLLSADSGTGSTRFVKE